MDPTLDRERATRLLRGLEAGGMGAADATSIAEILDPVLVHVIARFLRENYPASDPAASPVLQRLVQLTAAYPGMVDKCHEGEQDAVSIWFEQQHGFHEFRGRGAEMIALIVDKLDS